MNDMAPDAASFLADMPFLEDAPAGHAVAPADAAPPGGLPDQIAQDAIPDSTAFLMDGLADGWGGSPAHDARMEEGVDHAAQSAVPDVAPPADPVAAADGIGAAPPGPGPVEQLLPPSVALSPSRVVPRDVLEDAWGAGRHGVLSTQLGFHVGNLRFVVPFDGASELSEMVSVYRLPNVPPWFRGLANLHGNLVPVFDVAAMVGVGAETRQDRMLLVLGHGQMAAGILVNELPTRVRLESASAVDLPELPDALKDCVPRAYLHEREVWLELQYQRFFETTAARLAS